MMAKLINLSLLQRTITPHIPTDSCVHVAVHKPQQPTNTNCYQREEHGYGRQIYNIIATILEVVLSCA